MNSRGAWLDAFAGRELAVVSRRLARSQRAEPAALAAAAAAAVRQDAFKQPRDLEAVAGALRPAAATIPAEVDRLLKQGTARYAASGTPPNMRQAWLTLQDALTLGASSTALGMAGPTRTGVDRIDAQLDEPAEARVARQKRMEASRLVDSVLADSVLGAMSLRRVRIAFRLLETEHVLTAVKAGGAATIARRLLWRAAAVMQGEGDAGIGASGRGVASGGGEPEVARPADRQDATLSQNRELPPGSSHGGSRNTVTDDHDGGQPELARHGDRQNATLIQNRRSFHGGNVNRATDGHDRVLASRGGQPERARHGDRQNAALSHGGNLSPATDDHDRVLAAPGPNRTAAPPHATRAGQAARCEGGAAEPCAEGASGREPAAAGVPIAEFAVWLLRANAGVPRRWFAGDEDAGWPARVLSCAWAEPAFPERSHRHLLFKLMRGRIEGGSARCPWVATAVQRLHDEVQSGVGSAPAAAGPAPGEEDNREERSKLPLIEVNTTFLDCNGPPAVRDLCWLAAKVAGWANRESYRLADDVTHSLECVVAKLAKTLLVQHVSDVPRVQRDGSLRKADPVSADLIRVAYAVATLLLSRCRVRGIPFALGEENSPSGNLPNNTPSKGALEGLPGILSPVEVKYLLELARKAAFASSRYNGTVPADMVIPLVALSLDSKQVTEQMPSSSPALQTLLQFSAAVTKLQPSAAVSLPLLSFLPVVESTQLRLRYFSLLLALCRADEQSYVTVLASWPQGALAFYYEPASECCDWAKLLFLTLGSPSGLLYPATHACDPYTRDLSVGWLADNLTAAVLNRVLFDVTHTDPSDSWP
ncbi:hypothetical protein DIPPA_70057 [Diplonema papillatum]|nr:hypothetical protein DIPPA_70057 [Diplonema papillatum]